MSPRSRFRFRLYVAGDAQNSALAITNLNAICRAHLQGRHEIEVVDVFRDPRRALADNIFMTPSLVRLAPLPTVKIVGTLSDRPFVMRAMGLDEAAA